MNTLTKQNGLSRLIAALFKGLKRLLSFFVTRILWVAVIFSILSGIYWFFIASDRYVSDAQVIIQRTDLGGGQPTDFSSLLTGGSNNNRGDQLLLRNYLLSEDMLKKLDAKLHLREHYSNSSHDPLSRMYDKDASWETFYQYYQTRVSVDYDDYAGVLDIHAQAYDPKTAQAITTMLTAEGEHFMNTIAHNLAQAQVDFLEKQVVIMNDRVNETRDKVIDYQNKNNTASPMVAAETISAIVAKLESDKTALQTQRSALQSYLISDYPTIVEMGQQIAAIDKQIVEEKAKLTTSKGQSLNRAVVDFTRLEAEATFAQDVYKTALVALEKGRIEATRTINKVSILQQPTQPEDSLQPRRLYRTVLFTILAFLCAGLVSLLTLIVRDHKD
jgi:capsular polysaccharide transport system permease protein